MKDRSSAYQVQTTKPSAHPDAAVWPLPHTSDALRAQQRFYAHLYVGLYHEIAGEPAKARRHILRAASVPANHYMGDVARVHAKILLAAEEEKKKKAGTAAKKPR